ncbi:hypothetical protein [Caulobacter sp.]|jgi:hypothetical protein|uniref:hypothetical protein n=1 Tax=Caulobacter sp. TaxID=78 RepID=UPI0016073C5D
MEFDPDRLRAIVGALGGVAVYGLVLAGAPDRAALRELLIRLACATPAAVILAVFFVKAALPVIPWTPLREAYLFGFIVGAFSWELLPLLFRVVKRRATERAEKL